MASGSATRWTSVRMGSRGSFIERDSLRLEARTASADAEKVRFLLLLAIAWLSVAAPAQAKPRDGVLHRVADADGIHYVSGTLEGVRPPREPVRELRITRLTAEDLPPLLALLPPSRWTSSAPATWI